MVPTFGKGKMFLRVFLLKPVTCKHHLAVALAAAQPEAGGCGRGKGLGPGRLWMLQHHVAISKQWHPMKLLVMPGGQAGEGTSWSGVSMAGEMGAAVMSKTDQDELQELRGGGEGRAAQVRST